MLSDLEEILILAKSGIDFQEISVLAAKKINLILRKYENSYIADVLISINNSWKALRRHQVYAYIFEKDEGGVIAAYIGRTNNEQQNIRRHCSRKESAVYLYKIKTGLKFERYVLKSNLTLGEASFYEKFYFQKYEHIHLMLGNKSQVGNASSGKIGTWDFDSVSKEAEKFESIVEWARKSGSSYSWAIKNRKVDIICEQSKINRLCKACGINRLLSRLRILKQYLNGLKREKVVINGRIKMVKLTKYVMYVV